MSTVKSRITIQDLIKKGLPITPGNKYIPKEWIPKKAPSLANIRKRLAKIKGNLADTISQIREED